jgi:hypothetical protein
MELLVLMIAEVVALRYYRALRDGTDDSLTADVAGRILSDEQRHVPFHCERLHASLAELPHAMRRPVMARWFTRTYGVTPAAYRSTLHSESLP